MDIYTKQNIDAMADRWLALPDLDEEIKNQLLALSEEEKFECFYRELEFGTGGLRGILGAGTNRMNIYTVRKATQGVANYILKTGMTKKVAIGYDSRKNSQIFARNAAGILLANHIDVYLYDELMPAPALSFATRYHNCSIGIMVTASHNPSEYNGYKVYNGAGCQVTLVQAAEILDEITKADIFDDVKYIEPENYRGPATLCMLSDDTKQAFEDAVYAEAMEIRHDELAELSVVYSPLNGTGNKPVRKILARLGVGEVTVVPEQELPDPDFPTCPYPNPEKKEALKLGLALCERIKPDVLLATDPDCDRVGIAVKNGDEYTLLTGNETGILLFDYICESRRAAGTMPETPVAVRTVVTSSMIDLIAPSYGVKVRTTLTGFKFIGELIGELEANGHGKDYIFGFEESYGYLSGDYVRDKDAVNASMLICQMMAHYKAQGKNIIQHLNELYAKYGYCKNALIDFAFKGASGMEHMNDIMENFRNNPPAQITGKKIIEKADYKKGEKYLCGSSAKCDMVCGTKPTGLPSTDMIEYILEDGSGCTVRPSGTEPKLKIYLFAKGTSDADAASIIERLKEEMTDRINALGESK